jgi:uncharacterized protein (DUF4415 family)
MIALKADPNDPEDFDVTQEALEKALAERRVRLGRPPKPAGEHKQKVTLRLSPDVLAFFRASGAGWQTRLDAALADIVRHKRP